MSDTHAQTAKVQADVQTADAQGGKPHIPPGHVEADRPVERLGDREMKSMSPYLWAAAIAVVVIMGILLLAV